MCIKYGSRVRMWVSNLALLHMDLCLDCLGLSKSWGLDPEGKHSQRTGRGVCVWGICTIQPQDSYSVTSKVGQLITKTYLGSG